MTEPTRIQPIVLNAPDPSAPEVDGILKGETIASVYLNESGLVPDKSCPVKFQSDYFVRVECTTAEELKAFQERLQKARDGFLYDANKDPHDGDKQVIVTQEQIDRAVEVATTMIKNTGEVSRAEVFKKAGIVANAAEFNTIFNRRGFDLNNLAKGGLEDFLETNRKKAAEVFEANLRGAFANNSKHAMVVKFWDGDGDLATRDDQYWVDDAIYDAALAVIDGNLKALSPSPQPSPLKGEGKEGGGTQVPSPPVGEAKFRASRGSKGEGDKDDGGIDLGFWGWSGVVAWGIASLALFFRSSRQRVLHALTAPMPPEGPRDRKVHLAVNLAHMSAHLRERLFARFFDYWGYFDERYNVLQSNDRMRGILYDLAQCESDARAVDYLWRVAAFAQKISPGELLERLQKATGGQKLALAEQAVYFLHLIANPDTRVETFAQYRAAEFGKLADGLKAPPSPIEEEGVTRVPSLPVGEGQGEGGREARSDAIEERWFVDEDGRKGATADGPPPLPEAEVAEPVKPAAEVASVRKGAPRRRRYHAGTHPAVDAGAVAAAGASGTPSPQPSPIKGEGKRASVPAVSPPSMPRTYEELLKDLNLDGLSGSLDASKLSEAIALGVSSMATADPRYEALEMQVWVLKEWMEEAKVADSAAAMRKFIDGYFSSEGRLDVRNFVELTQVKVEKARARKAEIRSRFEEVERKAGENIERERARRKGK